MAKRGIIGALLGHSPFTSLQKHMEQVMACVREVPALFEALLADDADAVNAQMVKIFELEDAADKIKNELRAHLPRSLFMPVDRRDLLEVLQMQDSIADTAQDIAGMLVQRKMNVPDFLAPVLPLFVARCIDACEQAERIINELDELLEMGFKGRGRDEVETMVTELNAIESETDDFGQQAAALLFEHEDDLKPVSVMMWYQLIEWIGDLADYAEKVGDRLRLLIAR